MAVAHKSIEQQASEVQERLMALIRTFAEANRIEGPILMPAMAMTCVNLAYGSSKDGHELAAIKVHREFFNSCCDEVIEAIAEGKL